MLSFLAAGGDLINTLILTAVIFSVLALGYWAFQDGGPLLARLSEMALRRNGIRAADTSSPRRRGTKASVGFLRNLVEKLKLTRGAEAEKNADLLTQAGWRSREALVVYVSIRLILPCVLTSLAIILGAPFITGFQEGMLGGSTAIVATYLPPFVLKRLIKARHARFQRALPDALDLLMICAESGLGVDGAFARVAREFRRFMPEMSDELHLDVYKRQPPPAPCCRRRAATPRRRRRCAISP